MESLTVYRSFPTDNWEPIYNQYYDTEHECDAAAKVIWDFLVVATIFSETTYRVVGSSFDCETFGETHDDDEESDSLCPA